MRGSSFPCQVFGGLCCVWASASFRGPAPSSLMCLCVCVCVCVWDLGCIQTKSGIAAIHTGSCAVGVSAHLQMQMNVFVLPRGRVVQLCSVWSAYWPPQCDVGLHFYKVWLCFSSLPQGHSVFVFQHPLCYAPLQPKQTIHIKRMGERAFLLQRLICSDTASGCYWEHSWCNLGLKLCSPSENSWFLVQELGLGE